VHATKRMSCLREARKGSAGKPDGGGAKKAKGLARAAALRPHGARRPHCGSATTAHVQEAMQWHDTDGATPASHARGTRPRRWRLEPAKRGPAAAPRHSTHAQVRGHILAGVPHPTARFRVAAGAPPPERLLVERLLGEEEKYLGLGFWGPAPLFIPPRLAPHRPIESMTQI
jgi:hypothetical protein